MLLEQNYEKIAEHTAEIFRNYARRLTAYAIQAALERRKCPTQQDHNNNNTRRVMLQPEKQSSSQRSLANIISDLDDHSEAQDKSINQIQIRRKKTIKTIRSIILKGPDMSDLEHEQDKKFEVTQIYYYDHIMMSIHVNSPQSSGSMLGSAAQEQHHPNSQLLNQSLPPTSPQNVNPESQVLLYSGITNLKGLDYKKLSTMNVNPEKLMFEICLPDKENRFYDLKYRLPLKYGDLVSLKSASNGKYLKICADQTDMAGKCFGCQVSFTDKVDEWSIFVVRNTLEIEMSDMAVYTAQPILLELQSQPFYKLRLSRQQTFMMQESLSYQLVGSYQGSWLQFLKDKQQKNWESADLKSTKLYYIRVTFDKSLHLAASEKKTGVIMKQRQQTMLIENTHRIVQTVQEISTLTTFSSSDIVVLSQSRDAAAAAGMMCRAVWRLPKRTLLENSSIHNGCELLLYNVANQQLLSLNKTMKKLKLSSDPDEQRTVKLLKLGDRRYPNCYRIEVQDNFNVNIRLNPQDQKYYPSFEPQNREILNDPLSQTFQIIPVEEQRAKSIILFGEFFNQLCDIYTAIVAWGRAPSEKPHQFTYSYEHAIRTEHLLEAEADRLNKILSLILSVIDQPQSNQFNLAETKDLLKEMRIFQLLIYLCKVIMLKSHCPPNIKIGPKNSFSVATRILKDVLLRILSVLFKATKSHKGCSNVIIQFAPFFNTMLMAYPQPVGVLLQQTIKNLSLINTSSSADDDLFQWVKLIQTPSSSNIGTQSIYLQIIAEVVVDPSDTGILRYQNKCLGSLFNQPSGLRNPIILLTFAVQNDQPVVVFPSQKHTDSKQINRSSVMSSSVGYKLLELKPPELRYVSSYIKLLRNLCKDRNRAARETVERLGVTLNFINTVLDSELNTNIKMDFLSLYMEIFIDKDPYLAFNKAQKFCYVYKDLLSYDLSKKTGQIFKQYTEVVDNHKIADHFDAKVCSFIRKYFDTCLIYSSDQTKDDYVFLIRMIKFLKNSMNLGYLEPEFIAKCMLSLVEILRCYVITSPSKDLDSELLEQLCGAFVSLALLYRQIINHLIVLRFLCNFAASQQNFSPCLTNEQIMNAAKSMIQHSFECSNKNVLNIKSLVQFTSKSLNQNEGKLSNSFEQIQMEVRRFIIQLISHPTHESSTIKLKLLELGSKIMMVHEEISDILENVELITDPEQENIYQLLKGISQGQLPNIMKLNHQIAILAKNIAEDSSLCHQFKNVEHSIPEINIQLKKLDSHLGIYEKKSRRLMNKVQNFMQKMRLYDHLKVLLAKCTGKQPFWDITLTIHSFILSMVKQNPRMTSIVAKDYKLLLNVVQSPLLPKIMGELFAHIQNQEQCLRYIFLCFSKKQNKKGVLFVILYKIIQKYTNKNIQRLCFNFLTREEECKAYLTLESNTPQFEPYIRLLCFIVKRNPDVNSSLKNAFSIDTINSLLNDNLYQNKGVFLNLLATVYCSELPIDSKEFNGVFERRVLSQLKMYNKHSFHKPLPEVEVPKKLEKNEKTVEKLPDLKISNPPLKKPLTLNGYESLANSLRYWEYIYNQEKYCLLDFVEEILLKSTQVNQELYEILCKMQAVVESHSKNKQESLRCSKIIDKIQYLFLLMGKHKVLAKASTVTVVEYLTKVGEALAKEKYNINDVIPPPQQEEQMSLVEVYKLMRNLAQTLGLEDKYKLPSTISMILRTEQEGGTQLRLRLSRAMINYRNGLLNVIIGKQNKSGDNSKKTREKADKSQEEQLEYRPSSVVYEDLLQITIKQYTECLKKKLSKDARKVFLDIFKEVAQKCCSTKKVVSGYFDLYRLAPTIFSEDFMSIVLDIYANCFERVGDQQQTAIFQTVFKRIKDLQDGCYTQLLVMMNKLCRLVSMENSIILGNCSVLKDKLLKLIRHMSKLLDSSGTPVSHIRYLLMCLESSIALCRTLKTAENCPTIKSLVAQFDENILLLTLKLLSLPNKNMLFRLSKLLKTLFEYIVDISWNVHEESLTLCIIKLVATLQNQVGRSLYSIKQDGNQVLQVFDTLDKLIAGLPYHRNNIKKAITENIQYEYYINVICQTYWKFVAQRKYMFSKEDHCSQKIVCSREACNKEKLCQLDIKVFEILCKGVGMLEYLHFCYFLEGKEGLSARTKKRPDVYESVFLINETKRLAGDYYEPTLQPYQNSTGKLFLNLPTPTSFPKNKEQIGHYVEALSFYMKAKGHIQIVKDNQTKLLYFEKPFLCSFTHPSIKADIMEQIEQHSKEQLQNQLYTISKIYKSDLQTQKKLYSYPLVKQLVQFRTVFTLLFLCCVFLINSLMCFQAADRLRMHSIWPITTFIFIVKAFYFGIDIRKFALRVSLENSKQPYWEICKRIIRNYEIVLDIIALVLLSIMIFDVELRILASMPMFLRLKTVKQLLIPLLQKYPHFLRIMLGNLFLLLSILFISNQSLDHDQLIMTAFPGVLKKAVCFLIRPSRDCPHISQYTSFEVLVFYIMNILFNLGIAWGIVSIYVSSRTLIKKYELVNLRCLLCRKSKEQIIGQKFEKHLIEDHNIWNYLYYFMLVDEWEEKKDDSGISSLDKYVRKCVAERNWSFLRLA